MKIAIAILISAACLAGCAGYGHDDHGRRDRHGHWRAREIKEGPPEQVREAKREVARRCGPLTAERRRGTDGTQTADYDCGSVSKK